MARLTDAQWDAIRTVWEFDPDQPSLAVAADRAAAKLKFSAPNKTSVSRRQLVDETAGNPWERRGSLSGINKAAHRKADAMVDSDGERNATQRNGERNDESNGVASEKAQAARKDSEDVRAEVIARHRTEWKQVAVLRQEGLQIRATNPDGAFSKLKLAKIAAETTKIQQDGERKAWGLDELGDFDPSKLSDDELDKLVGGR